MELKINLIVQTIIIGQEASSHELADQLPGLGSLMFLVCTEYINDLN